MAVHDTAAWNRPHADGGGGPLTTPWNHDVPRATVRPCSSTTTYVPLRYPTTHVVAPYRAYHGPDHVRPVQNGGATDVASSSTYGAKTVGGRSKVSKTSWTSRTKNAWMAVQLCPVNGTT